MDRLEIVVEELRTLPTRVTALFFVLVALGASALGAQGRPVQSDQQILIQLERDWESAFLRKDVAFITSVLAEEFVAIYPDGTRGDKAHELSLVAALDQQIESSTLEDFSIEVSGDKAAVTFTRRLAGPVQGRRTEITYRFTDVFVWRGGRWQCVSSQSHKVFVP